MKAVGDEIRVLKEKLKAEGLSGNKINQHEEIKPLVAKLQELKKQLADQGGCVTSAAATPKAKEQAKAQPEPAPKDEPKAEPAAQLQRLQVMLMHK